MKNPMFPMKCGTQPVIGVWLFVLLVSVNHGSAYEQYYNPLTGAGYCSDCHGAFTDATSPKGTIFPSGSKHEMHRASTSMATACNLCHSNGDNRDPYTYTSDGTANTPGLGCSGCHVGAGLRAHHAANGITICSTCHHLKTNSVPENVQPPYYGSVDTKANHAENLVPVANTNENWSIGDYRGLDNDGNNLYDAADFACSPYRILSASTEGNNVRVTWQTAGGRRDALQAAATLAGPFTNVASPVTITGIGIMTTNLVDSGGATNTTRFYRLHYEP